MAPMVKYPREEKKRIPDVVIEIIGAGVLFAALYFLLLIGMSIPE